MENQWAEAKHKFGVDDLVMLPELTEEAIISTLNSRYVNDFIYTYIGPVLISVNPFTALPIFTDKFIEAYCGKYPYELPPHIYALAENAYRTMLSEDSSQCIIISGESGAGKTEASKLIMQYIAAVSGNGEGVERVKHVILESNPLLEAFGNAKTIRNNNSSRFGKFFQIFFNGAGDPEGGAITNYLLEKSRVVIQNAGERNFHIFYQLCSAAHDPDFSHLGLSDPSAFHYLNQSGDSMIPGVDDYEEFKATINAMNVIGIDKPSQASVFKVLAGILHLGNVQYSVGPDKNAHISNPDVVATAAKLLEVETKKLTDILLFRTLETGSGASSESYRITLNVPQATAARDSYAKALYDRIFDWIIGCVNKSLNTPKTSTMSISVLDIYGFEIFEKNGFEQFCINFVNEKLQQIFIELTLRAEQDEYKSENIEWVPVQFFNNKIVCDLIEGKTPPGVFAILDDVCKTSYASESTEIDVNFEKELTKNVQHDHFVAKKGAFDVKHYAGDVRYIIEGFSDKNKDHIFDDLKVCAKSSKMLFLKQLFPEEIEKGGRKAPTTSGFKIRTQAAKLVEELMKCTPHYIRCIKPNEVKSAGIWDAARVQHQVKYLGLLENVRVRRAGFAFRQRFERFIRRYQCMLPQEMRSDALKPNSNARDLTIKLLESVPSVKKEDWQLGRTKVFIRRPETLFEFEEKREQFIQASSTKVQKFVKACVAHSVVRALRYQGALLFHNKKERRRESLLLPFNSDYCKYADSADQQEFMKEYIAHPLLAKGGRRARTQSLYSGSERLLFSEPNVSRLAGTKPFQWETGELYFTTNAIYSIGSVVRHKVPAKMVRNRLAIVDILSISLSTLQDNYIAIHVKPGVGSECPEPKSKAEWMSDSSTKVCLQTGAKFSLLQRRSHCRNCGKIYIKECVSNAVSLKGFAKSQKVCDSCVGLIVQEDQLFIIDHKLEFLYRLKEEYRLVTDKELEIKFNNSYSINRTFPQSSTINLTCTSTPSIHDVTKTETNDQIQLAVPPGLPASTLPTKVEVRGGVLVAVRPFSTKSQNIKQRQDIVQSHAISRVSKRINPADLGRCRVIHDYSAEDADTLSLKTGDVITIIAKNDSGWWEGNLNGQRGFFPSTYVEMIDESKSKITKKQYCKAKFPYQATSVGYLSFKEGDVIEVVSSTPGGWWSGILAGTTGLFPSNYVEPCNNP